MHSLTPESGVMIAWSVVSLLTYLAHNFHSMLVCRFILGIAEAPVRQTYTRRSKLGTSKLIVCAGFTIAAATYNVATRYVAIMIFVGATYGVNNIVLAGAAASCGETDEKKAVAIAIADNFGNIASVYTPYLWPDS
jgi:MFS family permease